MTVAFHAWNPFQVFQIASVARAYGDSVLLLEERSSMDFDRVFDRTLLDNLGIPVIRTTARDIAERDGEFSVIVCQTPFRYIERLRRTKLVAMQYSMTKERHQYGAWRAMCDLNLVYGEYSKARIAPLSPCRIVGNPRFDPWFAGSLESSKLESLRAELDPAKPTLLYLPTWGDLSSVPIYQKAIADLSPHYNVIAKVHHNTDVLEIKRKISLSDSGIKSVFGASDDLLYLLKCSDIVLSDYSGAIFDAINVSKPVILLQNEPATLNGEKFGFESIEYARRSDIGLVAERPEFLVSALAQHFRRPDVYLESNLRLKQECFGRETNCGAAGAEAIEDLLKGKLESRPHYQAYIKNDLIRGREASEVVRNSLSNVFTRSIAYAKAKFPALGTVAVSRPGRRIADGVFRFSAYVLDRRKAGLTLGAKPSKLLRNYIALYPDRYSVYFGNEMGRRGFDAAQLRLLKLDASNGSGRAIARLVTRAGRTGNPRLLRYALRQYNKLPDSDKAVYALHAIRASEAIGGVGPGVILCQAIEVLTRAASAQTSSYTGRLNAIHALIRLRAVEASEKLIATVGLRPRQKKQLLTELKLLRDRGGKWYNLIELATKNASVGQPEDFGCYYEGEVSSVSELPGVPKVEFLIPPYLADIHNGSDRKTHDKICDFLRSMLDALKNAGFAIVPKHQYWLSIGHATGSWPALSYHTSGMQAGRLHLKDAAIPGFFRFDSYGYAGFSSIAQLDSLPQAALRADADAVEQVWNHVQRSIVAAKVSKYHQNNDINTLPYHDFIFFPLQLLDDAVMQLARIPMLDALQIMVSALRGSGKTLVVKRHPLCQRIDVEKALRELENEPSVVVTSESIHELLPRARSVVTINSGVGFEALLYGKHVVTLGAAEYGMVTERCFTKEQLTEAMMRPTPQTDLDQVKRFVWLYLQRCIDGKDFHPVIQWVSNHQPQDALMKIS